MSYRSELFERMDVEFVFVAENDATTWLADDVLFLEVNDVVECKCRQSLVDALCDIVAQSKSFHLDI